MGQEQSKQNQVVSSISKQFKVDYEQLTKQLDYLKKRDYKFIGYLGKGAFGLVIQAHSQEHGNVAIKILDKKADNAEEIFKETSAMEKLGNCENIIKIYECLNCIKLNTYFIINQLCDCNLIILYLSFPSTLRDVVESNKLSLTQIFALTEQLLKGLDQMKNFNVVHCDIKPENILYIKKNNRFVFSDFGLSHQIKSSMIKSKSSVGGTLQYLAPELLDNSPKLTYKSDVFSLGVTVAEILRGQKFEGFDQIFGIKQDKILDFMPISLLNQQFCNQLIKNMVCQSQIMRKDPQELLDILHDNFQFNQFELSKIIIKQKKNLSIVNDELIHLKSVKDLMNYQDRSNILLDLRENGLGAVGVKNIGMSLEKCQNITSLHLNLTQNDIGAEGAKNIGMSLEKCPNITSLDLNLYWNNIGAEGAKNIGMSLEKCPNITSLDLNLDWNNIGAEGAKNIGMSLEKCQNINSLHLNLTQNDIGAEGAKNIGMSLEKCQNITSLNINLQQNDIGTEGAKNVGMSLEKCQNITSLDLNYKVNGIGAEGAKNIGMSLEKCQNITSLHLNLYWNSIGAEGAKNIGMSLEKCPNITSLDLNLRQNDIGAKGAKNIGMSLEKCPNITSLDLNLKYNKLGAEGAKNIGMSLEKCPNITCLDLNLSWNNIGAEGAKNVGMSLEKCPNITSFWNNIGAEGAKNIGMSLEKCPNITSFDLNLRFFKLQ